MYAIIADGCTDLVTDNLAVCIRYVNMKTFEIQERFLKFAELKANELDVLCVSQKISEVLNQHEHGLQLTLENVSHSHQTAQLLWLVQKMEYND